MYYIYGISGPSLLIESTDSMIIWARVTTLYGGHNVCNNSGQACIVCLWDDHFSERVKF